MYIADYLNSRRLFQYTGGWMQMPDAKPRGHAFAVLLQRASQVLFHLDQCEYLRARAVEQFSAHLQKEPSRPTFLHAWSPLVTGLIVELSGAFAALRIMQNDSWALISAMSNARNMPASIRDAYTTFSRNYGHGNKRPRWLEAFGQETINLIVSYWKQSGAHLADYRDVDQHHDVLARGAVFFPEREGLSKLSIQLPDNPEAKSRARFTYTKKTDAFEVAKAGFSSLHALIESIAQNHGATLQPIQQTFEFNPPIEHRPGVSVLTAIVLYDLEGRAGIVLGQNEKTQVTIKNVVL